MVENIHKESGGRPIFPGMVTESLSQGVAADMFRHMGVNGSLFDNAEGLIAADGHVVVFLADKKIIISLAERFCLSQIF